MTLFSIATRKLLLVAARAAAAWLAGVSCACAGVFLDDDKVMVQGAPDAIHYNSSPDHAKHSWLVGAEWQSANRWLLGYWYFNNSFSQKSHYVYGGKSWLLGGTDSHWYWKLTGGVILGYKEPYEDKIPFNHNGVAPGVVPSIGYQWGRVNVQLNVLGTAGLMFTLGYDLFR